ncbi:sensor domain-containing diguanylate cyclase [Rhizobium sp. Leaf262]|uniref:sensor domain-containing diguanylate cyclase n=1 Tax=Rhizobium sp. Leaf262 TaxID=1736312 RepID=UPI00071410B4|nr:sensor domain-containing diguanylate cyclase [Rhizobium sp. Leaf262]KQO75722.1 diguanylate cyclase [Rhizobium sp. Leaf262]
MDSLIERVIALQDMTPVFIALYDTQDRLRHANRAFRQAFNVEDDAFPTWGELLRANYLDRQGLIISTGDYDAWFLSAQSRRGKLPFRGIELDLHDGRWIWMTETVQADGWMLCVGTDITALRQNQRSLRQDRDIALRAAQTDELTGTANRRFVFTKLAVQIENVEKGIESPFGLCVMDIDFFKGINDRFGHQGGDTVLRDFVKIAHSTIRRSDTFGRVGGEEFVLIMPRTVLPECIGIVERLLEKVRISCPFPGATDFSYSCSAGLSLFRPGETATDLYHRADRALYEAKQRGRARVEWVLE